MEFSATLSNNIESKITIPSVWNKQLNNLSITINALIKKLYERNEQAKKLAVETLTATDKERRAISRDLHDSVGQLLVVADLANSGKQKLKLEIFFTKLVMS